MATKQGKSVDGIIQNAFNSEYSVENNIRFLHISMGKKKFRFFIS